MDADRVSARKAAAVLNERHAEWKVAAPALTRAGKAEPPRLTCEVTPAGCRFDLEVLEAECAARICRYDGCERLALGESGGCAEHGHVFLGGRAEGVKRPDIGPKISKAKTGFKFTPESRAKMSAAHRKYEPQKRFDRLTGEQIIPKRAPGLEDVPLERLAELGLDLVPGWIVKRGHGLFVSQKNKALHQLEHDPDFGQPASRQVTVECWLCLEPIIRCESQVAKAEEESRRFVCTPCDALWRPALAIARRMVDELDPRGSLPERSHPAVLRLWDVALDFELYMRESLPPKRGQPRDFAKDLVIEALHLRGWSDENIDLILEARSPRYTETRRHNRGIRRRGKFKPVAPRLTSGEVSAPGARSRGRGGLSARRRAGARRSPGR
jgi:hypothetical protein